MLLKRIDETIASGMYDLGEGPAEVEVYLAEPSLQPGKVHWAVIETGIVPRSFLHYNDAADGSNTYNGSWQKFYVSGKKFDEQCVYDGSSKYFSNGMPNFGGVAKAAIYLRYSKGFLNWLRTFDQGTAMRLESEIPEFEAIAENKETMKLPNNWHDFKAPREKWPLIVICTLSNGKKLVHWLNKSANDDGSLAHLGIDVEHSLALMQFWTAPKAAEKELIAEEFQSGSGLGRNAFGKTFKLDDIRTSEFHRLLGAEPESSREELLSLWGNKIEYREKVAPSPETSSLIFLPEGTLLYSKLKKVIDGENTRRTLWYEAKKSRQKENEDREALEAMLPEVIPVVDSTTIFLTNLEGSTKKKRIVQMIFPGVSLPYLQILNSELLSSNIGFEVVNYMKSALTGQKGDTPSVYRYWTVLFTRALQKQPITAWEVFHNFQRFAKSHSGETLIEKKAASAYFRVIRKILRLQHLIMTARERPDFLYTIDFQQELLQIESFYGIKTGVFGMINHQLPAAEELLPAGTYELLRDTQKSKLNNFIRQAWAGVPEADFPVFVHGALVGMLLSELCWNVQQEGRRFSATQGRHPSRLRGRELIQVFDKGIGLLMNLDKVQRFNCRLLPFVKSMEQESRRDSFNSGLIIGMVYSEKKSTDNSLENNEEVEND